MRAYRGRGADRERDRAVTDRLVERVADERRPAVRVWRPHRQLAFGRRDATADGYERAREVARERGFPPVEREVGGRAVAYSGSAVAFVRALPVDGPRGGIADRYDAALTDLQGALADLGVDAERGEPEASFCPGTHSLQVAGPDGRRRKVAGLAQRVRRRVAVVAGVLVIAEHEAIASVLDPVYEALGVPFDPATVGSLALAGGDAAPEAVPRTVEDALVGDRERTAERVADV